MRFLTLFYLTIGTCYSNPIYTYNFTLKKGEYCAYGIIEKSKESKTTIYISYHLDDKAYSNAKIKIQFQKPENINNNTRLSIRTTYATFESEYRIQNQKDNTLFLDSITTILLEPQKDISFLLSESTKENEVKTANLEAWIAPIFTNEDKIFFIFTKGTLHEIKNYITKISIINKGGKDINSKDSFRSYTTIEPDEYMKEIKAQKEKRYIEEQNAADLQRKKDEEALKHEE